MSTKKLATPMEVSTSDSTKNAAAEKASTLSPTKTASWEPGNKTSSQDKEYMPTQMANATRASSSTEKNTGKEHTTTEAERCMMGSGIKIVNMDLDCTLMPMERSTRAIG